MSYFIKKATFEMIEDDYREGEAEHISDRWVEYPRQEFKSLDGALDYLMIKNHYKLTQWTRDDINAKGEFWNSVLVDGNQCEATENNIAEWKEGNRKLYNLNINIVIVKLSELGEYDV